MDLSGMEEQRAIELAIEKEREREKGRSMVRSSTPGSRDFASGNTKDPLACIYTGVQREERVASDPFKRLSDVSDKIHPSRPERVAATVAYAVENSCLRGAEQLYRRV